MCISDDILYWRLFHISYDTLITNYLFIWLCDFLAKKKNNNNNWVEDKKISLKDTTTEKAVVLNPRTYKKTHTPAMVQGRGGGGTRRGIYYGLKHCWGPSWISLKLRI